MQITGRAYFEDGRAAGHVVLLFVHVGFGGTNTPLATAQTTADGSYAATVTTDIAPLNLQIRFAAPDPAGGGPVATRPPADVAATAGTPPSVAPPSVTPPTAVMPARASNDVTLRMDPAVGQVRGPTGAATVAAAAALQPGTAQPGTAQPSTAPPGTPPPGSNQPGGAPVPSGTALTAVRYAVPTGPNDQTVINLVVPASHSPLATEYARLAGDVRPYLAGGTLGQAHEDGTTNDLTLLNRSSGWDARLIALAATAAQLNHVTGVAPDALYALMRVGLPSDPTQLARVGDDAVGAALAKANDAGIVTLTVDQMTRARTALGAYATAARRNLVLGGTHSNLGALLGAAGLTTDAQNTFTGLIAKFGDPNTAPADGGATTDQDRVAALWTAAEQAGLPVPRLQVTARLGLLTLNNATLISHLRTGIDGPDAIGTTLVTQGLYQPQQWKDQITALTGTDPAALAAMIPPAYPGADTAARLDAYSIDLARKVRLSYPTQVISHMIAADELSLGAQHDTLKSDVTTVLDRAAGGPGFVIGKSSLPALLAAHSDTLFQGMSADRITATTAALGNLTRIYQVSPDDESMKLLMGQGFTSARDIVAMPQQQFLDRYASAYAQSWTAQQIYRKAQQVTTVVYTVLGAAKQAAATVALPVASPPAAAATATQNGLVKAFPTLQALFGSMDFCSCADCRSVLSPAAYLVDILKFLDPDPNVWSGDIAAWQTTHGGAAYPWPDVASWTAAGKPPPQTPYEVLRERRPDLPRQPLTCENTNTVMPYVDIVNEILEYYAANTTLGTMPVYDTGDAASADLIAEPANVTPAAYDLLRAAKYPMTLPFDAWLETVRGYCDHFDAPLWSLLETLCPTDDLYPTGAAAYGRAAIFLEQLGIPPTEQVILTDAAPLSHWRELYGYDPTTVTEAQALTTLRQAPALSQRLGVSYTELVDLVKAGFLNPHLDVLATLRAIDLDLDSLMRYRQQPGYPPYAPADQAALEAKLGPAALTWVNALDLGTIGKILVLADPDAACGFDSTVLQYADGTPADPIAFVLINVLVRLVRRLGWSIPDTDRSLLTFLPGTPDPRTDAGVGPAVASALLGLAHLDALCTLLNVPDGNRLDLLGLWAPLDGVRYAEVFLNGTATGLDPAFDDALGHYLSDDTVLLADHLPAVQAALQLDAGDVPQILADAAVAGPSGPYTVATAPLTIPILSTLYRYALLATLLPLSVADLIALKGMSGLDPFAPVPAAPLASLADDHAYSGTVAFVAASTAVANSGLSIEDLGYLLRHRYDPVGVHRGAATPPLPLVRTIAGQIRSIRTQDAVPGDPLTFTDAILRQKLALVFPSAVTDTIMAMWSGTVQYTVAQTGVAPAAQLDPDDFAAVGAIQVSYDAVTQTQSLTYHGVLLDPARAALLTQITNTQPSYFPSLLDSVQQQPVEFFDRQLLRTTLAGVGDVGFLAAADFAVVFATPPLDQDADRTRRATMAGAFLPYLQNQLIRASVVAAVEADLGADPTLTAALLTDASLLTDPADVGQPLLSAYTAIGQGGLTVTTLGANSKQVSGYLEVPATGPYRFFVRTTAAGTVVDLRFDQLTDPLLHTTTTGADLEPSAFTTLTAGVAYGFTLMWTTPGGPDPVLQIQGEALPKAPVDGLVTYPRAAVDAIHRDNLLLAKVLTLAAALNLTLVEVRHLVTHPGDFDGLDLGKLPTRSADDTDTLARTLFAQFRRLVAYAALRDQLSAGTDLVALFASARRAFPADVSAADAQAAALTGVVTGLAAMTRRDPQTIRDALTLLGMAPVAAAGPDPYPVTIADLAQEKGVGRLWDVLALAGKLGVAPGALGRWATPTPDMLVARDLRDTVRALYPPDVWQAVVQPITDRQRQLRRDALVDYICFTDGFEDEDQLYEYFLIDPGTEPVVQTSRLRLAISAVQLFVQRCQLNLETKVSPSAIRSDYWEWMRLYRIWEANREIFLWPENWLEPEFRDDKTDLFSTLESTLMQSNLTNDDAEDALFAYLQGLDEMARLDIRAVYVEEQPDPRDNIVHVLGRTFAGTKYFYRSYAHQMWTNWLPITAAINGDHVVLAPWRDRVHVFWVTFIPEAGKPDVTPDAGTNAASLTIGALAALSSTMKVHLTLSWTELFQGKWTPAATSRTLTSLLPSGATAFDPANEFVYVAIADDGAAWIHLSSQLNTALRLVSRNADPTIEVGVEPTKPPFAYVGPTGGGRYRWDGPLAGLRNFYVEKITTVNGVTTDGCPQVDPILKQTSEYDLVVNAASLSGMPSDVGRLVTPFFFADDQNTFYIEPTLTETTITEGDRLIFKNPIISAYTPSQVSHLPVVNYVPPGPKVEQIAPEAVYAVDPPHDWATEAGTTIEFGATTISASGAIRVEGQI